MAWRSVFFSAVFSLPVLLATSALGQNATQSAAPAAPSAAADQTGPLNIHITAVQGALRNFGSPVKRIGKLTTGMDFVEGVEFRTGAHGTIQFMVGTDQVFRVDRLSVVKMLRANLLLDGTIRTDLGMTYGRVSKDVDQPARPHSDTIVSPASTLAVRGTEVSLFDSPPYAPEAVSLTGKGIITNHLKGLGIPFGAKGEGTAKISGDQPNAVQGQLVANYIAPQGAFGGPPAPPTAPPAPAGAPTTGNGLPPPPVSTTGGGGGNNSQPAPPTGVVVGPLPTQMIMQQSSSMPVSGFLGLILSWNSTTPATIVNLSVVSPLGEVISPTHTSVPSGGMYIGPNIATAAIDPNTLLSVGKQGAFFGTTTEGSYPSGTYMINATLVGTANLGMPPVQPLQGLSVNAQVILDQGSAAQSESGVIQIVTPVVTLDATNPTASFRVDAPALATTIIQQTGGNMPSRTIISGSAAGSAIRIKR